MRRGAARDLHRDDRGVRRHASILPVGKVPPVPGGNASGCGPMADGIPCRQSDAGEERLIDLLPGVNGAQSVGVARGGSTRIVRQVEDVGDSRGAIVVAKVVALPVDAAVQNLKPPLERSEVLAEDLKRQLGRSEALAEDLKPQSEQVKSLSEHVQGLAAQYEREQKQLAAQVETLTENMVRLGEHVTVLTNAYEGLQKSVNAMIAVSNTVVRDMDELLR